jgi:GMP synthase (glutamine-hydrolysing)
VVSPGKSILNDRSPSIIRRLVAVIVGNHKNNRNSQQVAILDFGSQYSHLIARRVRELHVYCELYSCLVSADELAEHDVTAVILSGGPSSVYEEGAPHVSQGVWDLIRDRCIPVLGICYGMQELAHAFGGTVEAGLKHEYGKAVARRVPGCTSDLFAGLDETFQVWMSHGDKLRAVPAGFKPVAATDNAEYVAIENLHDRMWGLQFHPEVTHTPHGKMILKNFCVRMCGAKQDWVMTDYAAEFIDHVREKVGPDGHVLGAVSGGVDSTVAAVLLTRAIGDRFHAVLVDNGCLRKDEAKLVVKRMREDCGVNLRCVDAGERFLSLLKGVTDPEQKRKIIGGTFIDVFQEEAKKIEAESGPCQFLLQGTLYPDVIESVSYKGPSATIKTHHNVGGLPAHMHLKLIEPLRELFKDEVRELGIALGIDEASVWRHPFPGPGLAIRILGEVTAEMVAMLQEADAIVIEELVKTGHYRKIGQAFVVLLPCKSVGVMGDGRTYENVACVRCVETTDYMTADFYHLPYDVMGIMSSRVINEVRGINRLCYDISSKPPATIEWE